MRSGRTTDGGPATRSAETRRNHPEFWPNTEMEERTRAHIASPAPARTMPTPEDEFRDLLGIAFDCFPIGCIIVALDGRFLHANPTFCRFLGRTAEDLRRHKLADFADSHERATLADLTSSILDRGLDNYREQRSFVRPDGRRVRLDLTGAVLKSAAGHKRAILALAHEITDSSGAAAPSARASMPTTIELAGEGAALREELETFCRTVSQEFRNPLRIIEGYADIVLEDCGESLDAMSLRHLSTIREQSRRLSGVVDHALSLARITSRPLRRESLDLSALALDAAAVVRAQLHVHDVEARIEPGLFVVADQGLVGRLLQQLFQNAFRFARDSAAPCVEFGSADVDGVPAYYVRDNGSGFDMALAYKLFLPFETLHEGSTTAGAGNGLAEVERIVHRHGGQVWAESSPGAGATFYFTLPVPAAANS